MVFESNNPNIRYTGRWGTVNDWGAKGYMTAVAPGAYFEFAFKGAYAEIEFYTEYSYEPHGNVYIEVDGGVSESNAAMLCSAGVDVLVAGSGVFGKEDRKAAISALIEKGDSCNG